MGKVDFVVFFHQNETNEKICTAQINIFQVKISMQNLFLTQYVTENKEFLA